MGLKFFDNENVETFLHFNRSANSAISKTKKERARCDDCMGKKSGRVRNAKKLHRPQLASLNSRKLRPREIIQQKLVAISVGIYGRRV